MLKHAFKLYRFAKKKGLRLENYRKIVEEMQLNQSETEYEDCDKSSVAPVQSAPSEAEQDPETFSEELQTPVREEKPEN